VGRVNLLMLAVDHGLDHFICAWPALSQSEFEVMDCPRSMADDDWRDNSLPGGVPPDVPFRGGEESRPRLGRAVFPLHAMDRQLEENFDSQIFRQ
jgi:hypothetical protein